MASTLLNCELVDLKNKLYKMTWWATALNQITAPEGMVMSGGSIAFVTNSNGVKTYVYNATANQWKEYSVATDVSNIEQDIDALEKKVFQVIRYEAGITQYDINIGELTQTTGSTYIFLFKFFGSATTFYYDLVAVSFNESTPIFNYISRNTSSITITDVSYADGVLTFTFNTSSYVTGYYLNAY